VASTEFEELQEALTISDSARAERLARQVQRMAAHVDMREADMQRAEDRTRHLEMVTDALYLESRLLRERLARAEASAKQAQDAHQAVMDLKTMRMLRRPRAFYAWLLRRWHAAVNHSQQR
jgi:hypothetical protein